MHRLLFLAACSAAAAAAAHLLSLPPREYSAVDGDTLEQVSDAQLGLGTRAELRRARRKKHERPRAPGRRDDRRTLCTEEGRQRAEQLARELRGITNVINELRIAEPLTIALDEEAAAEREKADVENMFSEQLRADAVLGSRSIEVTVHESTNTVTLTGTVSSEEELRCAPARSPSQRFSAGNVRNLPEVRQRL